MKTDLNANRFFEKRSYPQTPDDWSPVIIACGIKTPENIGHLIRIAGNTGARQVLAVHAGTLLRATKINRIAGAAGSVVRCSFCTAEELPALLPSDYKIVALETAPASTNLFETQLPVKMALMVGNESEGIPPNLLSLATQCIHIPITGKIKSLNVSHAAAICMFEWCQQHIL